MSGATRRPHQPRGLRRLRQEHPGGPALRAPRRLRAAGRAGVRAGHRHPRARRHAGRRGHPRRPAPRPATLAPWTEALLYAAARAELVETRAAARARRRPRARPRPLHRLVARLPGLRPRARRRRGPRRQRAGPARRAARRHARPRRRSRRRARARAGGGARPHRGARASSFQQRVAAGFAALARRFPERVRLIDGFRDVELVAADVEAAALEARRRRRPAARRLRARAVFDGVPGQEQAKALVRARPRATAR